MTCRPEWISPSRVGEDTFIRIHLLASRGSRRRNFARAARTRAPACHGGCGKFRQRVHSSSGRAPLGRRLPVFPVEWCRRELGDVDIVETAGVDVDLAGVRARHVERMNAAMLA